MADAMTFPKTVEEFMEEYKIVDSDQVYTNGAELVPIFRMKQWFEHTNATSDAVSVVRCKDCKHAFHRSDEQVSHGCSSLLCDIYVFEANPEFFCADGERKGGDE